MLRARNRRLRLEIDARQRAEAELANERRRVAGQLHDTLQQTITAASLQLHAASKLLLNDPPSAASSIDLAHQLIVRSREELRDAVWDLRVDDKARVNLHELLSRLCQEFSESHQTRITFAGDTNTHLPAHLATQIVRVTREATTNALKHASASSIQVQLTSVDSTLTLTIKDNGRGFNLDRAPGPETGHFGLSGMKESLERIGGSIVVKSTLGAGTVVKLKIQTV
jgi:signal transduction histidine kinase